MNKLPYTNEIHKYICLLLERCFEENLPLGIAFYEASENLTSTHYRKKVSSEESERLRSVQEISKDKAIGAALDYLATFFNVLDIRDLIDFSHEEEEEEEGLEEFSYKNVVDGYTAFDGLVVMAAYNAGFAHAHS